MKVTVYQTLQSQRGGGDPPVEVRWARDTTPLGAAACVATILRDAETPSAVPFPVHTTAIRIEITHEESA